MLTRVKRKISKQLSHENISEAENKEESAGRKQSTAERKQSTAERKQSTAERKQSTAERKQSRAERKRSTTEKQHARSKSLESSDSNPEVEYLMYEMQGLQAEVNALKSQLEDETKRSQELKNLKTQQVCALTFKLASAIRQREKAEENAAKALAEVEKFRSQVTDGINGCVKVITYEKREDSDKLRKISEESDSSEKLDYENEKEEDCQTSDNVDSKSRDIVALCSRKTAVVISQNELQRMMAGPEESHNESGYHSFNGEDASKTVRDAETQTLIQEDKIMVDQGTQGPSAENFRSHQAYQELVSHEFSRIQEELGEVKGNMSMMHALNQRLSEDLHLFTKNYERLRGQTSGLEEENKLKQKEDQLSAPVSTRPDMVRPDREEHHGSNEVDHGICETRVETLEEKVAAQVADVNYGESERERPSGDNNDKGNTMEKVVDAQEAKGSQEEEEKTIEDFDTEIKADLRQAEGGKELGNAWLNDKGLPSAKAIKSPELATVHQVELLKEQLKIAMKEIDQLRFDNNDMKKELRKISSHAGSELLIKTTRFTDQLLREMKQRETMRSQVNPPSVGKNPSTFETDEICPPKTVTPAQCPQLITQPRMARTVRGLEQSSRPYLPLRRLGHRLQEMTETLDDMTERPQAQELVQTCVKDPLVPHPGDAVSPSFMLKHRYQRQVLKREPLLPSSATERLGFEPILGSREGAFVAPMKLGEQRVCSGSSVQLVERRKPGGFLEEERSKPLDFSRAIRNSCSLRDARKPFSAQYTNDYIQRHIVRSSDYIAKLRDLRPEELDRPQDD